MHIFLSILAVMGAVCTAVMYWFGLEESYFWYYPWFDTPLHIVAGLTVGLWGASLAWRRRYSPFRTLFFIVLLALSVGLVWELYEYMTGLSGTKPDYWADTLGDLGNDVLGALVAWIFYWLFYPKKDTIQ